MKATGIVRRIDELGRIVIPKEIRRTLRIREGDSLEIFTEPSGKILLKKYSLIEEMSNLANNYAEVLSKSIFLPVLISDRDHIVAVSGTPKKEFIDRKITAYLEDLMESRKCFSFFENKINSVEPIEGVQPKILLIYPIISNGDINGSLIVLKSEKAVQNPEIITLVSKISSQLLGKQLEE